MYYLVRIRGIEQGEGKALHFARPLIRRGGAERVIIGEGTLVNKQQHLRAVHIAKTGQGKGKTGESGRGKTSNHTMSFLMSTYFILSIEKNR